MQQPRQKPAYPKSKPPPLPKSRPPSPPHLEKKRPSTPPKSVERKRYYRGDFDNKEWDQIEKFYEDLTDGPLYDSEITRAIILAYGSPERKKEIAYETISQVLENEHLPLDFFKRPLDREDFNIYDDFKSYFKAPQVPPRKI